MEKRLARWLIRLLMLFEVFVTIIGRGHAVSGPVWQIGRFNESSSEFNSGSDPVTGLPTIDYRDPSQDPVYVIGTSIPSKHWFASQPGSADADSGFRPHPFTILFNLPGPPTGLYTLKVGTLIENPRVSILQVDINGRQGWFYQRAKLIYTGDPTGDPTYSAALITAILPTQALRLGINELVLTAVDVPGKPGGTSGIIYDALELDHDPDAGFPSRRLSAEVIPTVFYKLRGDQLLELVDVFVAFNERPRQCSVTLLFGHHQLSRPLTSEHDFGEELVELEVPEFTSAARGVVSVSVNGETQKITPLLIPGRKWTVFVVPHEHLDVGYTDYESKVAEIHRRSVDEAMEMVRANPDFRFSVDAEWVAEQFLAGRSEEARHQFSQLVREGKIFVPAQYTNNLTGFPSVEDMIRSLYPGYRFHEKYGGKFDYANLTDVPSYSWAYASVLAAAGLRFFVTGGNTPRGPMAILGRLQERSPFFWEGPDGSRILTWYSRGYSNVQDIFDLPPQVMSGHDSLPIFFQIFDRPEYKSDAVLLYGTQVENSDLFPQQASMVNDWNKIYAYPKLRFSGFSEAVEYIVRQFGDAVPVLRGDGGPYWEDGIASNAYYAALGRQNEHRALSAEKLSTLSSLINPRIRPDPDTLDRLWKNLLLMDEHTWDASWSVSDPESEESVRQQLTKEARATEGKWLVEEVLDQSMAAIADYLHYPSGTLVVFNSLSWPRSGLVEFDLSKGLEIVDLSTKQRVPYQMLFSGKHFDRVRFLADNVPAVGYKCFTLKPTKVVPAVPQKGLETSVESPFYKLVLDPESGSVRSIFDKELGRELVDAASPYRFDQYVYVSGGDQLPNRLLQYSTVSPVPELAVHAASGGRVVVVAKSPFGTLVRTESSSINTPRIETSIVLFDGQKKIEFTNRVHKDKVYTKEGVYFAFPLALSQPRFAYEIQTGFVDPEKDLLPGAGREWFSVQHWVAVHQPDLAAAIVPIDAPLVTLGDVVRGAWPTEFGSRKATVFSYIMNNYWDTNYVAGQGGDFTFRYVLTSSREFQPGSLSRLGWEEMSPLEADLITYLDKAVNAPRSLDAAEASFLQVDSPHVALVTWKRAEDEHGTILRFVEVGGQVSTVSITAPLLNVGSAWLCNALEKNQQPLRVSTHTFSFPIKPFQIITVRVEGATAVNRR